MLVKHLEQTDERLDYSELPSTFINIWDFVTFADEEEKEHLWLNAYNRRCAYDDLPNHKTYQEWYKNWGDKCEDSNFCEEAAEHYGYEGDLYDE